MSKSVALALAGPLLRDSCCSVYGGKQRGNRCVWLHKKSVIIHEGSPLVTINSPIRPCLSAVLYCGLQAS